MTLDSEVDKDKDSKDSKQEKKLSKVLTIKIKNILIISSIYKIKTVNCKINLEDI